MSFYDNLKSVFRKIVDENGLLKESIEVKASILSPKDALGATKRTDYVLLKGKERLMQAEFKGSYGQAFTDSLNDFHGSIGEILELPLKNNYERAIFISSLNAIMRHLRLADHTVHCKNNDLENCAQKIAYFIVEKYGQPRICFVGLQPALVETCASKFSVKVLDLDKDNIGKEKSGVLILDGEKDYNDAIEWCDIALVTGSVIVNGTIENILKVQKPLIFFGTTAAGTAKLMGWERFCPCSY
ncbi:DUF364 domain-containing protein [Thermoanaerobacterium saccharolyticum]|uniref:Uncharacterized protein (DUF4213/DUF364 family) n=3 Tax=Thermoanaerobacterium TaxID=28895 RepID=A0ABS4NFG1_9THEO|nr:MULTISPECIES: DUF364 domain-containing protein [Thermoanaerobacterium]AFK87228.1 hypothetical protein Tsac_2224 [Thermoanaerobacterium saccharolyticum JW/SL-YS485]ETO38112.1 hypothetical protein V518_1761 [Thermoanaerobacterium aotearoense SCUT27]MBP2072392.1 uncharacterized protein (DUF4213/DUF364 family) [Thermoanaerobacterium butyriciformans]